MGKLVHERAQHILQEMNALTRELREFDETVVGELRVGTSDTTAMYTLPPYVRRFAEIMPRIHLMLTNRHSEEIARQVRQGEIDLGIVTLPLHDPELEEHRLFEEHLRLVMPTGHALCRKRRVGLEDLQDMPMLLLDEGTRTGGLLRRYFQTQGFQPRTVLDSGSFEVIKRYIAEGVGISFLPESVVAPKDPVLTTREVAGLPQVIIGAIRRKGIYRTRAEKAFLELLRETPYETAHDGTKEREPERKQS
jgi:LysR family hydrogen peroxide-inducible transcriptional activator